MVQSHSLSLGGQALRERPAALDEQGKLRRLMGQLDRTIHQHAFSVKPSDQFSPERARRVIQTGQQILARSAAIAAGQQVR
jgi:hypothetical protein